MRVLSIDPGIKNLGVCLLEDDKSVLYWEVVNILSEETSNQNKKCSSFLKNKKKCSTNATFCKDNEYFCKRHSPAESLILKPNVKFCSNEELCKKVLKFVQDFVEKKYDIEYIIIEDQRKSTEQIKFISSCLFSFFCFYFPEAKMSFIPAKYKLMVYSGDKVWDDVPLQRYARNKFLAIKYCQELIKDKPELISHVESYNKLDDLSDCFNTAIYFIDNDFSIPLKKSNLLKKSKSKPKRKKKEY